MTTLERLKAKAEDDSVRMPSIKAIHKLLTEKGIEHTFRSTTNVVEYRSKGNRYVNSRHNGKDGYKIEISLNEKQRETVGYWHIGLNTSDSYYSCNSQGYARNLVALITIS